MNKQKIAILLAGAIISSCAISSNVTANAANTDISHSKETNKTIDSSSNKGVALKTVSLKDANGNVLENANQFDMLDIISTSNGKYLVVTQSGVKGYLSSSDFEIVTNGENSKLENLDKVSKVSNVTTVLNLRQDPSTNSNIIDTMPNNTTLKVIGKQGDWYKVKFNGKLGFVYGLFTDENEASNQKIGNTTVDQAKKNIVNNQIQKNKKQSYQDTLKGMINEAKAKKQAKQAPSKSTVKLDKSDVEMYTSAKRGTVDINSGWLNMRSGASINDKETGKLDKNANVTVLGHDGNWYLVRTADGQEGFVFGQYINVNQDNTKHQAPSHKTETPSQGDHHDVVKPIHPSDDKHDVVKPIEPSKPVKPTEPTKPVKPTDDHGHDTTTDPGKDKPVKPVEPTKPAVINNAPVLKASNLTINQGEKFTDAMLKATAQDKEDGNLTGSIVYTGHVNTEVAGNYTIHLSVKDSQGAMVKTSVTVTVKDVKPMKPLTPSKPAEKPVTPDTKPMEPLTPSKPAEKPIKPSELNNAPTIQGHDLVMTEGQKFSVDMLGLNAQDKEDGNLTANIKVLENTVNTAKAGKYQVVVKVTDKQGASCKRTFVVTVNAKPVAPSVINACPQITGHGVEIEQGTKFSVDMLGLKASDKEDGNLTDSIKVIENTVNANKAGNYVVKVKVTDKQGASMTKTFTVTVNKKVVKPIEPSVINACPTIEGHDVTITEGQDFSNSMLGLKATDKEDGNLTDSIKVTGTVDINKVGTYEVTAKVTDKQGAGFTKTFTVTVKAKPHVNVAPTINGKSITLRQGEKFNNSMLDVTANDQEDGNLTSAVKFEGTVDTAKVGTYEVTATVVDKNGAKASKTFTVQVVAEEAPVLNGKNITITEGDKFDTAMLGLTASDKEDGNLTDSIKIVSNTVNADKAGTYDVVAKVTDSFGKTTTQTFKVTVKAKPVVGWTADSKEFHNAVANEFYSLVNAERAKVGSDAYGISDMCVNAANWKSQDMLKTGKLDHKDANGLNTWGHKEFELVNGENILDTWMMSETGLTQKDAQKLAEQIFNTWMSSAAHRLTMVDKSATEMGFGFAVGNDGIVYATMDVTGTNDSGIDWN